MKKLILSILVMSFTIINYANDTIPLQQLQVVAQSGLKMRAHPGIHSQVLTIIPYHSRVSVIQNELHLPKNGKVGYVAGEWKYVQYDQYEGYVFDGYLSPLPLPRHEFERTQFDLDLIYPLESWMEYHQRVLVNNDTIKSPLYTKILLKYRNGSRMEKVNTNQYYSLKVFLPDVRLMDVYHLLGDMLSTKSEWKKFSDKTIFVANNDGTIDKINIDLQIPVTIRSFPDGVSVEIKSYDMNCSLSAAE